MVLGKAEGEVTCSPTLGEGGENALSQTLNKLKSRLFANLPGTGRWNPAHFHCTPTLAHLHPCSASLDFLLCICFCLEGKENTSEFVMETAEQ